MVRTKSVRTAIEPTKDGLRVLATRLRGRGLKKSRYHVWMPNLGPSEALLQTYRAGKLAWPEFARRYQAELRLSPELDRRNPNVKNHGQKFTLRLLQRLSRGANVTVMCHCEESELHCHRHLLAELLRNKIS